MCGLAVSAVKFLQRWDDCIMINFFHIAESSNDYFKELLQHTRETYTGTNPHLRIVIDDTVINGPPNSNLRESG